MTARLGSIPWPACLLLCGALCVGPAPVERHEHAEPVEFSDVKISDVQAEVIIFDGYEIDTPDQQP